MLNWLKHNRPPISKIVFGDDLLFHDMLPTLVDASTQAWFFDGIVKQTILETDAELHGKRVPPVH
jgi:hypothetical protein